MVTLSTDGSIGRSAGRPVGPVLSPRHRRSTSAKHAGRTPSRGGKGAREAPTRWPDPPTARWMRLVISINVVAAAAGTAAAAAAALAAAAMATEGKAATTQAAAVSMMAASAAATTARRVPDADADADATTTDATTTTPGRNRTLWRDPRCRSPRPTASRMPVQPRRRPATTMSDASGTRARRAADQPRRGPVPRGGPDRYRRAPWRRLERHGGRSLQGRGATPAARRRRGRRRSARLRRRADGLPAAAGGWCAAAAGCAARLRDGPALRRLRQLEDHQLLAGGAPIAWQRSVSAEFAEAREARCRAAACGRPKSAARVRRRRRRPDRARC